MSDETFYSEKVDGDVRNHRVAVRFDITDGYVGVTGYDTGRGITKYEDSVFSDRVLLSPAQVKALIAFYGAHLPIGASHDQAG